MKKILSLLLIGFILILSILYVYYPLDSSKEDTQEKITKQSAKIVANGDILYHDILYWSAKEKDGTYNFDHYFEYVKDRISSADLAIGDYEGTISDKHPLAGYPLFNAPKEAAYSMKNIGYDVVDLAHNHILDSGLYGAKYTYHTFKDLGLSPIGLHIESPRQKENILIKEVNGIKIAILAYAYGYNGMEANLTKDQYEQTMSDLYEDKIKEELVYAEANADITLVMPQMGVEYRLQPTTEQVSLYQKMIDWGADIVLGGHPHVAEPAEIVTKDGEKKLIIYSMGNFISNQTLEMLGNKWTERGLFMELDIEKENGKTIIKQAIAHPTYVVSYKTGDTLANGYPRFDYRVVVAEDFLENGKYQGVYSGQTLEKIKSTYQEMNEHISLNWGN